jgi:hypothetical protein
LDGDFSLWASKGKEKLWLFVCVTYSREEIEFKGMKRIGLLD